MSGYEAVRTIRLHETAESYSHRLGTLLNADRLPVFACSAHVEGDQLLALAEMGFDGFLSKPIDMKKLKRLVAGVEDAESRREEVEW